MSFIGVDIGGTKIFAARFDEALNIEAKVRVATEAERGKDVVLKNLQKAIAEVITNDVQAIGIAWAGLINPDTGVIAKAPHISGFIDFPLAEFLQNKFEVSVYIENDCRLFAYAESQVGCGKGAKVLWGITLGTGIGNGIVINGDIFSGHNGFAGEFGHGAIDLSGEKEAEEIFSGSALTKALSGNSLEQYVAEWESGSGEGFDFFELWIQKLSVWIMNGILTFNPSIVVFGGGIGTDILPPLLPTIQKKIVARLKEKDFSFTVQLHTSELENAGSLGAALYAKEKVLS